MSDIEQVQEKMKADMEAIALVFVKLFNTKHLSSCGSFYNLNI